MRSAAATTARKVKVKKVADAGSRVSGVVIAASGVAHFILPSVFVFISRWLFPKDTKTMVRINGAAETVIGVAIVNRRTRVWGFLGLLGYTAYLGDRVVRDVIRRIGVSRR
ncbi:hypothetical protein JVX90_02860 [Gordonia sp. PDNC005]|jgi:hypothetical protein|uniref:hypothetical protein n=1 Tax=unclassified Gordonia (in: high G+C Gram-positive bacteria) TaxID=2657482 RepID=UPI0019667FDB|nr:hypothetical protein [Gordonia sp. PDNC005]QRY63203.1 hypothetical protein JVX90_02860 [Gordonia sp. PDNC005]